jgi:hypothetical protein
MKSLIACFVALAILASGQGRLLAQVPQRPDPEIQVKAAVEGYLQNRNSFPFMRFKYTLTHAQTKSLKDALEGTNYLQPTVSRNLLLLDGPRFLHAEDIDEAVVKEALKKAKPTGKGAVSVSIPSMSGGYLTDGPNLFVYSPFLNCANATPPPDTAAGGLKVTPLAFGNAPPDKLYGPDYRLEMCRTGKYVMWPEGLKEIDGRAAVCVKFGNQKKEPTKYYAFDLERGFLPLQIITYEVAKGSRDYCGEYITHVRQCSNNRWFPERSVFVFYPENKGDLFRVRETKAVEIDVDKRPARADFTLKVKAGTNVVHTTHRGSFRLKQDEDINVSDLPGILAKCDLALKRLPMDTAIHPPDPYAWLRWCGYAATAVLLVTLVVYVVRRRSRLRLVRGPETVG